MSLITSHGQPLTDWSDIIYLSRPHTFVPTDPDSLTNGSLWYPPTSVPANRGSACPSPPTFVNQRGIRTRTEYTPLPPLHLFISIIPSSRFLDSLKVQVGIYVRQLSSPVGDPIINQPHTVRQSAATFQVVAYAPFSGLRPPKPGKQIHGWKVRNVWVHFFPIESALHRIN